MAKKTYGQQLTDRLTKTKTRREELATWCNVSSVQTYKWTGGVEQPSATARQCISLFFSLKKEDPEVFEKYMLRFCKK
jgi:hypothetical protein